jgi:hypothetical protein
MLRHPHLHDLRALLHEALNLVALDLLHHPPPPIVLPRQGVLAPAPKRSPAIRRFVQARAS